MSSADPLKSAISIRGADDTSLALPSANEYHSREQRVRAQVQSLRRTKSRHSSSGRSESSCLSPSSPEYDAVFLDGPKSSQLKSSNGSVFLSNGASKVFTTNRNMNNQHMISNMKRANMRKQTMNHYESKHGAVGGVARLGLANTSRSEPGLVLNSVPRPSVLMQTQPTVEQRGNRNTYMKNHSISNHYMKRTVSQTHPLYPLNGSGPMHKISQYRVGQPEMNKTRSQYTVTDSSSKTQINSEVNGNSVISNITMQEAVKLLSSKDENLQNCGASYIQHNTFINVKTKEEVYTLNGIPPLLRLLQSPNSQVQSTACAALRNLTFQNNKNKEEIQRCDGIPQVVAQLRDSESAELDKQLTGLLWNLSSADNLKSDLMKNALPVLMDRVILPYTKGSRDTVSADAFCYATGCLRNLSSPKEASRQTMRKYRGFIDGLAAYLKECVENNKTEDEALQHCVSILHNLTFHLEEEFSSLFININSLAKNMMSNVSQNDANSVGCFSAQSKPLQTDRPFDYAVIEDPQPNGAGLLIHSKTLKDYLSLLSLTEHQSLHDACWGILLNLTMRESAVSYVMSQIIVKKLNGMQYIRPSLKSDKVNIQKNAMGLVINLIKNPNLCSVVAEKAIPDLLSVLSKDTAGANESDDTLALACQAASSLVLNNVEWTKRHLSGKLIKSLNSISQNFYFPKSSKAASVLLIKMWSNKELQSSLKKLGLRKSLFVNDTTTAAQKSVQVVY
ncbi:PREDICTED: plakophilin-1-like [Poecilia mexicana]|uniref:Plakophilin 1b n=1 Tax=Poecilia mexicana TaxID=48701 RepID=A0A3B3WFQ1_9TELE|nr:PREDICTED: plakophilin-1-like [Poecilia mexicana]